MFRVRAAEGGTDDAQRRRYGDAPRNNQESQSSPEKMRGDTRRTDMEKNITSSNMRALNAFFCPDREYSEDVSLADIREKGTADAQRNGCVTFLSELRAGMFLCKSCWQ